MLCERFDLGEASTKAVPQQRRARREQDSLALRLTSELVELRAGYAHTARGRYLAKRAYKIGGITNRSDNFYVSRERQYLFSCAARAHENWV